MITISCDGCGVLLKKHGLRYTVKIDVRAAYDELEIGLADLVRDHDQEIRELIDQLSGKDPREVEETVYKLITLDLCPRCQRAFIRDPLHFHPERALPDASIDIDGFLRSLGYGEAEEDPPG
jgi:hypothetical protein